MTHVNYDFIERYQVLYQKDPSSKVFAPLGEAYRKMGLLDEALKVCRDGVKRHPDFPSGHVAIAKVLIDLKEYEDAALHLNRATELSPENILAHNLLAQTLLELRRPKEALSAFKMVLFLNPNDKGACEAIKKLESLTADEYSPDLFDAKSEIEPASQPLLERLTTRNSDSSSLDGKMRQIERTLSLADAYTVRNDIERALKILNDGLAHWGDHPEIHRRLALLTGRDQQDAASEYKEMIRSLRKKKQGLLKTLLDRISARQRSEN